MMANKDLARPVCSGSREEGRRSSLIGLMISELLVHSQWTLWPCSQQILQVDITRHEFPPVDLPQNQLENSWLSQ